MVCPQRRCPLRTHRTDMLSLRDRSQLCMFVELFARSTRHCDETRCTNVMAVRVKRTSAMLLREGGGALSSHLTSFLHSSTSNMAILHSKSRSGGYMYNKSDSPWHSYACGGNVSSQPIKAEDRGLLPLCLFISFHFHPPTKIH